MKHEITRTLFRIVGTRLFCSMRSTERAAVEFLALPRAREAIHTDARSPVETPPRTGDLVLLDPVRDGFSIGSQFEAIVEDSRDGLGALVQA